MSGLSRRMQRRCRLAASAVIVCFLSSTPLPALSGSCLEEVDRLAARHGVPTEPPKAGTEEGQPEMAPAPGETMTEELGESGGVIEPPEQGETVVIEPPDIGDPMETAPEIEPAPDGMAERTQLEALLTAARAAAEDGDDEACFERLREAREIAGRDGG